LLGLSFTKPYCVFQIASAHLLGEPMPIVLLDDKLLVLCPTGCVGVKVSTELIKRLDKLCRLFGFEAEGGVVFHVDSPQTPR